MNLPSFSVKHSIFGHMLTLFVFLAGIIMVYFMQRDTFPEVETDFVVISTVYPNASAEEIEDLITNPIEDEIRDVEDINNYLSTSAEGISVVTVEVDSDAKYKERVFSDIQRKVDQVTALPKGAEDPEVEVITLTKPIMRVCITGPVPEKKLRDYGDYLKDRIQFISGVSTVVRDGWRDEEFWVEADLVALDQQELALSDMVEALARRNVNLPGGKVTEGTQEVVIRTLGQFYTAEEIADVVVRSNTDGNHVRVKDVATVKRTFEEDTVFTKVNGNRAMILEVKKKRSGDTITISDEVKEILTIEQERAPPGIELTFVDDESYYVKRRLMVLRSNGTIGFIMVVAILFIFLNFRVAMITGIGIPFAFLGALLLMAWFGITINLITMFGLIIVLGMVVDDAIIVGENIFRYLEEGVDPKKAAVDGTTEVMYPVISTVLTTIAAFMPLVFAPDVYGQIMRWFPIVVSITLVASLFEVLFIMPCHVADFVRPIKLAASTNGRPAAHQWMKKLQDGYVGLMQQVLHHRYTFIPIILVLFGGLAFLGAKKAKINMFPADMIDIFVMRATAPQGTTMDETEDLTENLYDLALSLPETELENVVTYIGGLWTFDMGYKSRGTHYSTVVVYLSPQNTRERKTEEIVNDLREKSKNLTMFEKLDFELAEFGPPAGRALEVRAKGSDFETLRSISAELQTFLKDQPGVNDIQDDYEPGKDEARVYVDETEAARLGLNLASIAQAVLTGYQGAESTIIREGNDEVIVRVRLNETYRNDLDVLQRIKVKNNTGRLIPLSRVAKIQREPGLPAVFHHDGERVLTVSASVDSEATSSTGVNRALEKAFHGIPEKYPGYQLIREGQWKETRKLLIFMFKAFAIALMLIYVILAVQFDSFAQPFVVMMSIPLGVIGVVLALVAHGKPISLMAMMGIIGLTGVVVNDAIVLVKFINDLRRTKGIAVTEAIIEGGRTRLRPILLTSVTTIAGLIPVIYGIGGYEPFVAPAAIALAYGLLFATILTLVIVPAGYHVAYDVKALALRGIRKIRKI